MYFGACAIDLNVFLFEIFFLKYISHNSSTSYFLLIFKDNPTDSGISSVLFVFPLPRDVLPVT